MGITTDKLAYGVNSWMAMAKNSDDRGCIDNHTSSDVGILWAADRIKELEVENGRLRESVKAAFIEGWSDGHNEGIGCGHALAPKCRHKGSIEWEDSEALDSLEKADG